MMYGIDKMGKWGTFKKFTRFLFITSSGGLPTTHQRKVRLLLLPLIVVQESSIRLGILKEINKVIERSHHSQSQQSSTPREATKSSSHNFERGKVRTTSRS